MKTEISDLVRMIQKKQDFVDRHPERDNRAILMEIQVLENFLINMENMELHMDESSRESHISIEQLLDVIRRQQDQISMAKKWILALNKIIGEHRDMIKTYEPPGGYVYIPNNVRIPPMRRLIQIVYLEQRAENGSSN